MSSPWSSVAKGLATAQERARQREIEEADRLQKGELARLQRDALVLGLEEKRKVADQQGTQMSQRVATLRKNPRLAGYSDDELAGFATDEQTYRGLVLQMVTPPKKAVSFDQNTGKPIVYDPDNPQFPTDFVGPHTKPPTERNIDPLSQAGIDAAAKRAAEVAKAQAPHRSSRSNATSGAMTNSNMLSLRGQFNNEATVKNATEVSTALRKVRASAGNPSPAGDISLLVGYMKLLDPGSVVREQEFATAAKAGSLPQQIQAVALKVVNGQRLTAEQRADFIGKAEAVAKGYAEQFGTVRTRYQNDASAAGLDPARIVFDPFEGLFEAVKSSGITPAEREALKQKGFTDAQINAKYGTP